eukprot:4556044-Alexandrium_andersonii.AAC.1
MEGKSWRCQRCKVRVPSRDILALLSTPCIELTAGPGQSSQCRPTQSVSSHAQVGSGQIHPSHASTFWEGT